MGRSKQSVSPWYSTPRLLKLTMLNVERIRINLRDLMRSGKLASVCVIGAALNVPHRLTSYPLVGNASVEPLLARRLNVDSPIAPSTDVISSVTAITWLQNRRHPTMVRLRK